MKSSKELKTAILKNESVVSKTAGLFMFLFLFTFCSPKTTNIPLNFAEPEPFTVSGNIETTDEWWTNFNDNKLNLLIDSALQSNFNLKSVWQRLLASRAVVDRETSGLFPDLGASIQGGVEYPQPNYVGGEVFRFELSSDYEVDLWGRIRSGIDAEKFRTQASFADYQTASISLSAEIASTWFQLLEANMQLKLAEEQVETNEKVLSLIKVRFGSGQIRSVDILRQVQLLESTKERKINAESWVNVLENQLAVLLGQPPQNDFIYSEHLLPELPPLPETGIPSELIQRRPDVQSAFFQLQASDRDLATAISSKYPRLSFTASTSVRANNVSDLFKDWAYSLSGNLFAPIFNAGRLNAEVDRNEAIKLQRLYEYGETILIAFREVEDALIREKKQLESIQSLEEQMRLAVKTSEQLKIEYLNGMSNYLDVLTSLDQEQQLRRDLISAKLILLEYRIALYRALAGGFETERETAEKYEP